MTPEREKELLGLIEAYWRIRFTVVSIARLGFDPPRVRVASEETYNTYPASWAESEACLREVAGECAVREADIPIRRLDSKFVARVEPVAGDASHGTDPSRPVALLCAFISAFGGKEPPR